MKRQSRVDLALKDRENKSDTVHYDTVVEKKQRCYVTKLGIYAGICNGLQEIPYSLETISKVARGRETKKREALCTFDRLSDRPFFKDGHTCCTLRLDLIVGDADERIQDSIRNGMAFIGL